MSSPQTILIVEDEAEIRKVLAIELEHEGHYRCVTAADCEEALTHLQEGLLPQMMLVDIMMPGDSQAGLHLISQLKANPRWSPIPVVVLSARSQSEVILEALRRGAIDYLVKPYEPEDLLYRIQRACQLQETPESEVSIDSEEALQTQRWREMHVEVMRLSLLYWETATRKTKVDLAEMSSIWNTYIDTRGSYRTKTLNRYLHQRTLPKRPNTHQVLQTAHFVLKHCPPDETLRPQLQHSLKQLIALNQNLPS